MTFSDFIKVLLACGKAKKQTLGIVPKVCFAFVLLLTAPETVPALA